MEVAGTLRTLPRGYKQRHTPAALALPRRLTYSPLCAGRGGTTLALFLYQHLSLSFVLVLGRFHPAVVSLSLMVSSSSLPP